MAIKLSLICPVYKVAEYIPQLMQSLLEGVNNESVEIIFVDDCCPENSILLCEEFIDRNKNEIEFHSKIIKLKKNSGQAAARNVALKVSKGDYIGFIDSDDVIASDYYKVLRPYINLCKNDIIEFHYQEFSGEPPPLSLTQNTTELPSSQLNPFYTGFFVWTRLYKKKSLKELTFPEGMIYEDVYFNMHAFSLSKSIIRINTCLIHYRKRAGSTTALRNARYSQLLVNLVNSVGQVIGISVSPKAMISLLLERCLLLMLKGLKIRDKLERKEYYKLCWPQLHKSKGLSTTYGASTKAKVSLLLSLIICWCLK